MDNQWFDNNTVPMPGTHMEANCMIMPCLIIVMTMVEN